MEVFLKQHYRLSYLWARQCCWFDSEMAREVLHIALLKILEGKARFAGQSTDKTWLFSVIRITALEQLRKSQKHVDLAEFSELNNFPDGNEDSDSGGFHEGLLKKLPARQREVLLLVFYHDRTLEETARILNISPGAVSTHYDRGKKKLRELIEKQKHHADRIYQ